MIIGPRSAPAGPVTAGVDWRQLSKKARITRSSRRKATPRSPRRSENFGTSHNQEIRRSAQRSNFLACAKRIKPFSVHSVALSFSVSSVLFCLASLPAVDLHRLAQRRPALPRTLPQKPPHLRHRLRQPHPSHHHPRRKRRQQPARRLPVQQHEHPAIRRPPDQPPERLAQPQPRDPVVVALQIAARTDAPAAPGAGYPAAPMAPSRTPPAAAPARARPPRRASRQCPAGSFLPRCGKCRPALRCPSHRRAARRAGSPPPPAPVRSAHAPPAAAVSR